jgi:cob(I)alamin adenosyltransferase
VKGLACHKLVEWGRGDVMFYTGKGDGGETDLRGERVGKDTPRVELLGALDEASSAMGLGRAFVQRPESGAVLVRTQRLLSAIMAELAVKTPERLSLRVDDDALAALEADIAALEGVAPAFAGFIVPGDSRAGAALDLARATVRRAERRAVALHRADPLANPAIIPYLNRLSTLLYFLARVEDVLAAGGSTTVK